jgi:hypothetical protein
MLGYRLASFCLAKGRFKLSRIKAQRIASPVVGIGAPLTKIVTVGTK